MKLILFDIDGTLISSGGAGSHAFYRALQEAFSLEDIRGQVAFSGRTDRAILRDLLELHQLDNSESNWRRFSAAYLRHLPDSLVEKAGRVLPGVDLLLDRLAPRHDVCLGLLTGNARQGAELKLGHFRLSRYFAFGGFGDAHYERDDVARGALDAARELLAERFAAAERWVIGDTPLDIQCARAIDARCVAVATGSHPLEELAACRPDVLLTDLSDPAALPADWN